MSERSTAEELQARIAHAAELKLQQVPPALVLLKLQQTYGVSLRQARRYLAGAAELLQQDGIPATGDPFSDAAALALNRLQLLILEATPAELPRLVAALAKLRECQPAGPTLSDAEMLDRAAFVGGLAKLSPTNSTP